MKRLFCILLCAAVLLGTFASSAFADGDAGASGDTSSAQPPEPEHCLSAYLYCFENSRSLYEYNSEETVYPTSTVKIMTGLLALEHFQGKLDTKISVTSEMLSKVSGNTLSPKLSAGEVVTVEDMLYGCLIGGANDAAFVLAYAVSGSLEDFITLMNTKSGSSAIGARNTKYTNPTGIHDDGMYTTARDTAQIALYAWSVPGFSDIVSTSKYVIEETNMSEYRTVYNRNSTISKYYASGYYDERAIGMNAGGTAAGGYCTVQVMRDPETSVSFLCVVMGGAWEDDSDTIYSYENAQKLLNWAFDSYTYAQVLSADQVIGEVPVSLSSTVDYVTLSPSESVVVFLPTSVDIENDIQIHYSTLNDTLAAPIYKGQTVGTVTVTLGDEILGSVELLTTADVERSEFLYILSQIRDFTRSKFFIAAAVSVVIFSAVYIFGSAFLRKRRSRKL